MAFQPPSIDTSAKVWDHYTETFCLRLEQSRFPRRIVMATIFSHKVDLREATFPTMKEMRKSQKRHSVIPLDSSNPISTIATQTIFRGD